VEVFDPASTRDFWRVLPVRSLYITSARTTQKTPLETILLLRALQLPSNGPSIVNVLAGRCLAMSLLSLFPVAVTGVTGRSPAPGR
jgi:hypothetical protein